ncbi:nuclear transport factor 2 family protein [Streptomyces sp. H27-D2]|uniref:nuclear transport factor 2 family protein n=1 Tax=Streptomyces sp. H27-D2 TaxID=3046304 RepID=UPI002DBBA07E|nr:nuclear transport factor 2 family protein [Streptomyces sp. H27-D2]MEC4017336.1 nuclear transport factor 2 family protein [Streptomyces sp. H27-D2]
MPQATQVPRGSGQRVSAELYVEVQQFYARQMPLLEDRRLEEFLETFTEDCTMEHQPFGWKFEGRVQLLKEMSARRGDAQRPRVEETSARRARDENIPYYDGLVYRYWFDRMRIEPQDDDSLWVRYQAMVTLTDGDGKVSFEPTTIVEDLLIRRDGELYTRSRMVTHDSARWADKTHNPA